MAETMRPTVQCPMHRLFSKMRQSRLLRTATAANIAALRFLRDCVDRRLERLKKSDAPAGERASSG